MISVKKILYPTDFSKPSLYAFEYAVEMAKKFDAELEIVHVMFDETQVVSFYLPQVTFENLAEDMAEGAQQQLNNFIAENPELLNIQHSCKLLKGTPFIEIIRHAKETEAELIVIGTHGRTGLEHVLFGSTAEKVVRKAPCPVFTVRMKDKEFIMP
jgi:nucleotide-binding universal stress UspA family protein